MNALSITITDEAFDMDSENHTFRQNNNTAGAIVTFLGQVRGTDKSEVVKTLRLEHYPDFTEKMIEEFASRALSRWQLSALRIVHRVGDMVPTDGIVFIAAAAAHRRPAFEAVDFIMDYLKSEAPFWKQEVTNTTSKWVTPRSEDLRNKARWQETQNTE